MPETAEIRADACGFDGLATKRRSVAKTSAACFRQRRVRFAQRAGLPLIAKAGGRVARMSQTLFTKDNLPAGDFGEYRKDYSTRAMRIEGTFHCLTSEGNVASCSDGWLAVDSRGYPYPINAIEFDITYTRVESGPVASGGGSISD